MKDFLTFLSANYETLRALHLMAVVAWMAGLMYLPRLFVYHSSITAGSAQDALFIVMERRLYRGIMNPSLVIVWVLGISLLFGRGAGLLFNQPWFVVKFCCVLAITALHMLYGFWQHQFARSERPLSHLFFRFINELPFLLMMIAIWMVVKEPVFG